MEQKDFFIENFEGNNKYEPLALRMSLATLEDYIGQNSILVDGKLLRRAQSNFAVVAINQVVEEVKNGNQKIFPNHLKNVNLDGNTFGYWYGYKYHGYKYPHNYPNHYIKQEYMEKHVKFYVLSDKGYEVKN